MDDSSSENKTKTEKTSKETISEAPSGFKPSKNRSLPGLGFVRSILKRIPQVYIVEFVIYLLVSGSLIGISVYLWNSIISSIGSDPNGSLFGDSFAYTTSIGVIASIIVLLPALLCLQSRNHSLEVEAPEIKNNRWRKGFLAIFLLIIGLSAISSTIGLLQGLLTTVASIGLKTSDTQPELWKSIVTQSFNILLLVSVAIIYARDYRHNPATDHAGIANRKSLLNKGLALIVAILVIVFLILPFRKQRDAYVDSVISQDVSDILDKLGNTNKNNIDSVDDLDVSDNIKSRVNKYDYTIAKSGNSRYSSSYKVCANFKTDTSEKYNYDGYGRYGSLTSLLSANPAVGNDYESITRSPYRPQEESNPYKHGKGKQCFRSYASYTEDKYNKPLIEEDPTIVN